MLVFNKGSNPGIIVEYNGNKYMFGNDRKPVEIPLEAFISALKTGHIHAHELMIYEPDTKELKAEIKILKEENSKLKEEIKDLEAKLKKAKK